MKFAIRALGFFAFWMLLATVGAFYPLWYWQGWVLLLAGFVLVWAERLAGRMPDA